MEYDNGVVDWLFIQINRWCGGCMADYREMAETMIAGVALMAILGIGVVLNLISEKFR